MVPLKEQRCCTGIQTEFILSRRAVVGAVGLPALINIFNILKINVIIL